MIHNRDLGTLPFGSNKDFRISLDNIIFYLFNFLAETFSVKLKFFILKPQILAVTLYRLNMNKTTTECYLSQIAWSACGIVCYVVLLERQPSSVYPQQLIFFLALGSLKEISSTWFLVLFILFFFTVSWVIRVIGITVWIWFMSFS